MKSMKNIITWQLLEFLTFLLWVVIQILLNHLKLNDDILLFLYTSFILLLSTKVCSDQLVVLNTTRGL